MILLPLIYFLLTSIVYYLYGITPFVSWIILITGGLIFLALGYFGVAQPIRRATENNHESKPTLFLFAAAAFLDIFLLITLFEHQTSVLLPSPWQALEPWFFLVFALATALLFIAVLRSKNLLIMILPASIHFFVMVSVAVIIYKLGFGFDAFVHRATEVWIQTHGFILPKQPYYIGQYSFVVWLANLTQIPVFFIDVSLVPLLAAITIPATVITALKRTWNIPFSTGVFLFWLLPFAPFLSLHLTTPYNLALLLGILAVFTLLPSGSAAFPQYLPVFLSLCALVTHPLIGVPLCIMTAVRLAFQRSSSTRKQLMILALSTLAITISFPLLFTVSNLRAGGAVPTLGNPFAQLKTFFSLFDLPYWYATHTPWHFEILYAWHRLLPAFILILCLIGFFLYQHKKRDAIMWIYPLTAFGLVLSAWLLTSWIRFADVVAYEQGDYPLRLVKSALVYLLPFGMYALYEIARRFNISKYRYIVIPAAAVALMISLYLSYPQRNIKARFPGFNVTASDFKTVEWIQAQHDTYDYIVLSNQLVSAAALTNYSFAKYHDTPSGQLFYYSLPTGGLLYQYYGKMLYEGQKKEYMTEAMGKAGVHTGYFVVNSYWANADKIIEGAKKSADGWQIIDGGKIWVFTYTR